MKTMKKLLAAMLAIAMLLTCAAFNPLTATAEGAATDSSETTRYCGNDDYPAKSLGGNYSGMPLNIGKKSDDSTKAASRGGQTILAYARNKYTSDGSYLPYAAWVTFNTEDPAGSFTELSRGGVEFYEAAYDGELIYGLDTDNNFYSVNPETFESTLIGSISDTANSMTYDWEHDTFYIVNGNLQIRELRKDGSLGSAITPANVVCIAPVTYVGNGEFLSLDFNTRNYVRIAADGSTTQLAHSDGLQGWSSSMVYNREDGKCYICYTNMQNGDDTSSVGFWGKLFAIDPVTGEGEYRGFIGEDYGTYVNGMCIADFLAPEPPAEQGKTVVSYARNKYTSDGGYLPYAAWVSFNIDDPAGSFTELSRGGVEFYEAAYDGELIYGLDTDNNFYSVNPETFESTLIGSISDTANSMTYDWEHDTFYIVNGNLQIRELRKDGSLGSAITPANVVCIAPVTYVGNGEFLSLDFNTRNYVRIAADGSTTQLAHSDGLQGWSSSMVYNREDGKCYICYTNMQNGDDTSSVGFWGKLFAIDPVTGEGEYRGFIGEDYGTYVNGMCFIDMGGGEEPQATLDEAMNLVENRHHFVTEGEYPWVPVVLNDELCGASGNQDHVGTTSTVSTTVQLNAGDVMRFDWAVSCREDFERLTFSVNGTEVAAISGQSTDFVPYNYVAEAAGEYTFSWTYHKETMWTEGQDRGYVKNVYAGAPLPDESVEFAPDAVTVRKGLTAQLNWTVAPYYAFDQSVTLTSSNASIASVDANGVVRGVNEGTAVITATTAQGHTDTCTVTVIAPVPHTKIYAYQTQTTNLISFFTDDSAHVQQLGAFPADTYAMTYAHGVVYGIDSENNFFTSTPGSTQRTIIGQTGTAMITAMAYNYANGKIYAVGYTQQSRWDLYEINMQTGAAAVIGQPDTVDRDPLWTFAITTEGRAYGITATSGLLYEVNLETAQVTEIGFTGCPGVGFCQSLVYDHDNGIMFWAAYWKDDANGLREVNLETGESVSIGDIQDAAQVCGGYTVPSWDDPTQPSNVTVTFNYMVNGEWTSTEVTVPAGTTPTAPVPENQPHQPTMLMFIGWDVDFANVQHDITVTAQYAALGDVDMNGEIQIADALLIARNAIGVAELTPAQMILADVYGSDGVITLNDALVTMRISLGL